MRAVDLALYADSLAAEASSLAAQLERGRAQLRRAAIEREAKQSLGGEDVARLEALGILVPTDLGEQRARIELLAESLAALEQLQAWVESRLFCAREEGYAMSE